MAIRPVFVPDPQMPQRVREVPVEFKWHSGMSFQQKQRSVKSLHTAARANGLLNLLEISTKSLDKLGQQLSAFNLEIQIEDGLRVPVESAFQSSKVFEHGGPYVDLLTATGRRAKTDPRLKSSGALTGFKFLGCSWSLLPRTAFYDFVYISALYQRRDLSEYLMQFEGFTDIEFNPNNSWNCQARSAALFVALMKGGLLIPALASHRSFIAAVASDEQAAALEPVTGALSQTELFDTGRSPAKGMKRSKPK